MRILDQFDYIDHFSDTEQAVIQWVLKHKEEVLSMSTNELALKTYTSPASIVRLCQKLGLKGYNDFKIKLSGELEYLSAHKNKIDVNYPFKKEDDLKTVSANLAQLTKDSIDETLALINYVELNKIVDVLYNAKEIDIYASSFPLMYAMDFKLRMMHIGITVHLCNVEGEMIFQALNSNKDHCALIISYSGETSSIVGITELLKSNHVKTIAITNIGDNQIEKLCDYRLRVSSREKLRSKIANFSSHASITYLLDLLYAAYFKKEYEKNSIYKISRENKIDLRRSKLKSIDEMQKN